MDYARTGEEVIYSEPTYLARDSEKGDITVLNIFSTEQRV